MISQTRELVRLAEQHQVILCEEFEPGFVVGSILVLEKLFAQNPSANLQANLDLGHIFLCNSEPLAAIGSLIGRIMHGHTENMKTGIHRHFVPQKGDMNLKVFWLH